MRAVRALALCAGLVPGAAPAQDTAATAAATVEQPRSFGHVLGDVLTQRVLLEHAGRPLTPRSLPTAARVDLWFERRPARVETDAQGRRWLVLDYQLMNAPRALSAVALPALRLASRSGPTLALPAWPVSIAPLTPEQAFGTGDLQPLRPDRPIAPLPTAAIERQAWLALAALLGVLLAWMAWCVWRNTWEARRLPFAQAWRALRRIDDPAGAQAWRIVHRALNSCAGRVVHGGASLHRFLDQAPHLRPLQAQLEDFYRASTQRFFALDAAQTTPPYPLAPLSRALRDAEERHRR
ncbi:calcium incorporation protein MxaA [Verminephrobacter aporrectodeae subsp. tuberculatae]|uniref:calcium incorporation protein MxaA n=1 Tax=Verminephrobacter aporrectodeae TaxID=1110389 RepID=UPI002242F6DB|nr:calcium incorporation protein MxaA [Verminephrobacter aporrectodeae]MCW8198986.1 calcium incorporation protein MxaA [Verminephrobacter aporrectodeae subsp. tuberculatae]